MSRLVLVRHAAVEVAAGVPASRWHLSARGRRDATMLAAHFRDLRPRRIVSSEEPKARETAECLAGALGVPAAVEPGLQEHRREGVPYLGDREFADAVARFFERPNELVLGEETAAAAGERIERAVREVIAAGAGDDAIAVTGGTVLSLFAARVAGVDAHELWRSLALPAYVVFSVPDLAMERVVARVEHPPP